MGGCLSTSAVSLDPHDFELHREAEKQLKEAKAMLANQVKLLLLGSGDSGKSTILKQMRVIHKLPFSPSEIEQHRQLVFENMTSGLRLILEAMADMELAVEEANIPYVEMIEHPPDIGKSEPFPASYLEPLKSLWDDHKIQRAVRRGNEAALPENLPYFFRDLDRFFLPNYQPTNQDIIHVRSRTTGLTQTSFRLKHIELLMVDVGGQKSERRKWMHCFQDVTTLLFLASLSGYDQCLVEDRDANQMQDAMTIWDSICHSQWFEKTAIILFLNKNDLFEKKVEVSPIRNYFPDFDGEERNPMAGRAYFKRRFVKLARKSERAKDRDVYVHVTTATDTAMLRVVMSAVEEQVFVLLPLLYILI